MTFDFIGVLFALSFALDCVERDIIGVTTNHGKRVAALAMQISRRLGVLAAPRAQAALSACAVMHDCALTEYIQDEFSGSYEAAAKEIALHVGEHCAMGEASMRRMPFEQSLIEGAVLYHHETPDGRGPFGKRSDEIPAAARLIQIADSVDARFHLSQMDDAKRARLREELTNADRYPRAEAEAFATLLANDDLRFLRDESIDASLRALLPETSLECSPEQLALFAGVFASIVDYKSHFTCAHSLGVAKKAREMALFYRADEELAAKLYFAGALHDVGKLVIDREILEKPASLSAEEYRRIQTHAHCTYQLLSSVRGIEDITSWASCHHEKLDGTGYPFGLTANDLGRWERLLACLDVYQALTEERPYKTAIRHAQAIGVLKDMTDRGLVDPQIVRDMDRQFAPERSACSLSR